MTVTLIGAGLLLGLAASPHCAAMCGTPCGGIARACGGARPGRALLAWHLGRAAAYAAAGAVAALAVDRVAAVAAQSAMLRPAWAMLQAACLVFGLVLVVRGQVPAVLDAWARAAGRRLGLQRAEQSERPPGWRRAAVLGLLWVAWPCGVLYGALAVAAFADGAGEGAAVMLAFSAASAPGLVAAPWLWSRLARLPQRAATRLAGGLVAAAGLWSLSHALGMAGAIAAWCGSLV